MDTSEAFPFTILALDQPLVALIQSHSGKTVETHLAMEPTSMPDAACPHTHLEFWAEETHPWHCKRCKVALHDSDRLDRETMLMAQSREEDGTDVAGWDEAMKDFETGSRFPAISKANTDRICEKGVSVKFLVAFTFAHNCWQWPTWRVMRDIVSAATAETRCRYADLPECQGHTGLATVFCSHCWGAPWGDMVAAVCCGAHEDRFVWIDCFAVRQWPGNVADLDFQGVIGRCPGFILATTSLLSNLSSHDIVYRGAEPCTEERKKLAFFRVWVLIELGAALLFRKEIVMRAGHHVVHEGTGDISFQPDNIMLEKMFHLVNVLDADATVPADRARILQKVEQMEGGAGALNSLVKGAIRGALIANRMDLWEVQAAACGEREALAYISPDRMGEVLTSAAASGYLFTVQEALEKPDVCVDVRGPEDDTPLMEAARAGHSEVVEFLIDGKANINTQNVFGNTPLMRGAYGGHLPIVQVLVAAKANMGLRREDGGTALMEAAVRGHATVVSELLTEKADIEAAGFGGYTALMMASFGKHSMTVNVLLDANANVNVTAEDGSTALIEAAKSGSAAIVDALLLAKSAVDARNDQNRTALMYAMVGGTRSHVQVLKSLLGAKAGIEHMSDPTALALTAVAMHNPTEASRDLTQDEHCRHGSQKVGGPNLECRFYENEFPRVEDVVIAEVMKIVDMGAYVRLLEYNNKEGASRHWPGSHLYSSCAPHTC